MLVGLFKGGLVALAEQGGLEELRCSVDLRRYLWVSLLERSRSRLGTERGLWPALSGPDVTREVDFAMPSSVVRETQPRLTRRARLILLSACEVVVER